MGVSVSAATVIIVVALFTSGLVLSTVVQSNLKNINTAYKGQVERWMDESGTGIQVLNTTYNPSTNQLTLIVKNTGRSVLSVKSLDLIVDGRYRTMDIVHMTVDGINRIVWYPETVLELTADMTSQPSRIMLVTEYGVAVYDESITIVSS